MNILLFLKTFFSSLIAKSKAQWAKVAAWIGTTGENQLFIDFMAHGGISGFFVLLSAAPVFPRGTLYMVAGIAYIVAAIKEFWFDLKYEANPKQTLLDSERDFAGYFTGITLALIAGMVLFYRIFS